LQALFDQAYQQRARLALLTASGTGAQWQRHGLKASAALGPWLETLGAGGGTPLPQALAKARAWLLRQRKRLPGQAQRCVVVTDGRIKAFEGVDALGCDTLLVDIELGSVRLGKGRALAQVLEARYVHLEALARP
jgi:magnesium chelatase subunit ChlD-like protein